MSITIQCNLKTVDFLDVTFYLDNNVYKPFHKENNKPIIQINTLTIEQAFSKNCQSLIGKRISETSSKKDIFDESIKPYKDDLKEVTSLRN